jgi:type III restriction enzyme
MKLKFKQQAFQTEAVKAVVDCFVGQPRSQGLKYTIDPGRAAVPSTVALPGIATDGFGNERLLVPRAKLLENVQSVQRHHNLPISADLRVTSVCDTNLDIEMETGTGKTYCYIKTMFELHRVYGWAKFIVVVPSIAIREGVLQSFESMAEHFLELYGKRARHFVYNSGQLHNLESYSSDAGVNVMIINVQAFNARGEDARRIYLELDDFQSRRPIDVIRKNRPILILDEPQKMEGGATTEKLKGFDPLMVLRYSATHRTEHNKIYRLDAIDAYNQKLVKKIAVRGIGVKGFSGTNAYLYLENIRISPAKPPEALVELEFKQKAGIKRFTRVVGKNTNLRDLSDGLEQYHGFVVSEIDARDNTISFTNGVTLGVGEVMGDVSETALRRIQIREAIKTHFEKEQALFAQGIKVLSLFFIDEVAKYRRYTDAGEEPGDYARIFEEEYAERLNQVLTLEDTAYNRYVKDIAAAKTHQGYFSIDNKSKRLVDPKVKARGENAGEADDVDAYDLILRDKERLLGFNEPVRFLFSHSALREGWDNPNVFVICTLKHSDNSISRRQEVGRGMRLARNQNGDRIDDPAIVHQVNVLTVVANESYKDFVAGLQKDILAAVSARPRKADLDYFTGKVLKTAAGEVAVTPVLAKLIVRYLAKHDYTDAQTDNITETYHVAKKDGTLVALPPELEPYKPQIFELIDAVFSADQLPDFEDDRKSALNPRNGNFDKKEFQELWGRINRKAIYAVDFQTDELVAKCVKALDLELRVMPLQYIVIAGTQKDESDYETVKKGDAFVLMESATENLTTSAQSTVKYDLIGKLAEATQLTRRTIALILREIQLAVFSQYKTNPEDFMLKAVTLINEQKATVIVEHLTYSPLEETYGVDIFSQEKQDLSKGFKARRHILDYVFTDSGTERTFVGELDASAEVVVYAKLPRSFQIPTPVGNYSPDWAIAFDAGRVKHIYFVAETKGSMSTLQLKEIEKSKIECARKFFAKITTDQVRYEIVNSYGKLMELVK